MEKSYDFEYIDRCNMCGEDSGKAEVLGQRLNRSQGKSPKRLSGISVSVMKCRRCSLIFANPLPKPANIQDHYGKDHEY